MPARIRPTSGDGFPGPSNAREGSPWLHEKKASPMSMIGFPLLLIPLTIYNIIVFLMPGVSFADPVLKVPLMSGAEWPVTLSDMLLALAILLLLSEVIKGARPGAKYLTDHLLSLIVFGGAVAEFLLWPRFGGSTFFLLTLLALVDFLSGLALRTRRRMPVAAAAPVAESALPDHPPPKTPQPEAVHADPVHPDAVHPDAVHSDAVHHEPLHPEVVHPEVLPPEGLPPETKPHAPSPEVASPGLQPGTSAPPSSDEPPPR